jgi:hypothetical protein
MALVTQLIHWVQLILIERELLLNTFFPNGVWHRMLLCPPRVYLSKKSDVAYRREEGKDAAELLL